MMDGQGGGFFDYGPEQDYGNPPEEDAGMPKMPESIKDLGDVQAYLAEVIFGNKPDRLLDSINCFMQDLEYTRSILVENHFPGMPLNLLYFPFFFAIMLFNCIREGFMWWLIIIAICAVFMAAVGGLCSVCFTIYRGYSIYTEKFPFPDGKEKGGEEGTSEKPSEQSSAAAASGSSASGDAAASAKSKDEADLLFEDIRRKYE